ncbi:MAG: bifunctional (p)ppGpp synthetase/guanosine-3',5'-bis(diphosphate) 3'-pyrophosphohydrolase [Fibrobacterales bacterium]|nr:bifunctional (p)ppGpp synthetase/guanosine-3',5'-bis(diphosphate) 3'-pyrophosphohydrolase [Fibrobacterales bacterium]
MADTVRPAQADEVFGQREHYHGNSLDGLYDPDSSIAVEHLLQSILKRNPNLDSEKLRQALQYSISAHSEQVRKSGMPYAEHPVEVAKILAEYQMDTSTIIAGLLHDVVEDTPITLPEVQSIFGAEVAFMVDAVTKISELQAANKEEQTAETYRKLLSSMAEDPRVLMIKIADRLHNMRTLGWVPKAAKRKRIAQETLDIYAPLAHRFGLAKIRCEMEDLAFKVLNPEEYGRVMGELMESRADRESYIQKVAAILLKELEKVCPEVQVQGRPKHVYGIWQKQKRRNCRIDQIYDNFALRVIVPERRDCYIALGEIHALWVPLQARFKDYVATPKPNLYQSIHTTVVGPDEKMVEIQIRTREMDVVAERGFAAHWSYKAGVENASRDEMDWLRQLVRVQNEISDSKEFLEFLKIDLKPQELVVFTPAGDPISLPHGATVLDFAYAVHTEIGNKCIGARIDGLFFPPEKTLGYGSTVAALLSAHQHPAREWLSIVKTHKATASIRKYFRDEMRKKFADLGEVILNREYKALGIAADCHLSLEDFRKSFPAVERMEQLHEAIGSGRISLRELRTVLAGGEVGDSEESAAIPVESDNLLLHFSHCCTPIPGDEIVGLLVPGEGIAIHRTDCPKCREMLEKKTYESLHVQWGESQNELHSVDLMLEGASRRNLLEDIATTLAAYGVDVTRGTLVAGGERTRLRLRVKVAGTAQLEAARQKLLEVEGVEKVERRR